MLKEQILFLSEVQSFIGEYRNSFIESEVQYHSDNSLQNVKEIRIEKYDHSEGTIEFLPEAQSFLG